MTHTSIRFPYSAILVNFYSSLRRFSGILTPKNYNFDENGGTKIRVMDDFTKCDMLVEEVQDINENGEFYVTDYKFTNHLIHDASHGSVSNVIASQK